MLLDALRRCNDEITRINQCCHRPPHTPCKCEECLGEGFTDGVAVDSYDCLKKMDTYAIKYGPCYVSEIYHYLKDSNILNSFNNSILRVVSLGCGFAPDYYALAKYIEDNGLNITVNYYGLDNSTCWDTARPPIGPNCHFFSCDLTQPFTLSQYNPQIIFICKSFSTIYRNGYGDQFLDQLEAIIQGELAPNTIIVFIDVDHYLFGRDIFHTSIHPIVRSWDQYYFQGCSYIDNTWIEIKSTNIIYNINNLFSVSSECSTKQTIIFEYRK